MIYHDVEQNTDEWSLLRAGKIGGSSIGEIMANEGKAFGNPAKDLAVKLAIEQLTGQPQESGYTNEHMQRGHEQEPIARQLYEQDNFCTVTNGGFFEDGVYGVSPDGLVDDDGLVEIKSVMPHIHFATVRRNTHDPAYKWQVYLNLMVSGLEWIDFVSFCADFPEGKRLFQSRVERKNCADLFGRITSRVNDFCALIADAKKVIDAI